MVAELGVEPRLSESESLVLPLHHSAEMSAKTSSIQIPVQAGLIKKCLQETVKK